MVNITGDAESQSPSVTGTHIAVDFWVAHPSCFLSHNVGTHGPLNNDKRLGRG